MTKLIILNSMITPILKHPMSLGTMLMFQTMMMMMSTQKMVFNSWYLYIMFITMISGLMVMFMYMSSIASNEKFNLSMKMISMYMILFILMTMINLKPNLVFFQIKENKMFLMEYEQIISTSKFFNMYKMNLTIMLLMILLLTMISVSSISSNFEGPLKKTYV